MKTKKNNHLLLWLVLLIPVMLRFVIPASAVEYEVEDTTIQIGSTYYELTPEEEYVYFLIQTDPEQELTLEPEKILFMNQEQADANGTLSFSYAPNAAVPAVTALYGKDVQNLQEITWSLRDDGVLAICGNGAIRAVSEGIPAPWSSVQESVYEVRISSEISQIGASAFENCVNLRYINFAADAPIFDENCFAGVTATAFYPATNETWTQEVMQNYGGDIRWFEVYDQIMVESIELSEPELILNAMDEHPLTITVSPENASNLNVHWQSSDESVATVDANGIVKALTKGTAEIVVTAEDGSGVSASCLVTVKNSIYMVEAVSNLESPHNYEQNCSDIWQYTLEGAEQIEVVFDEQTDLEKDRDFLHIFDKNDNLVGIYTGTELAGQAIVIPDDTVKLQLVTDENGENWGFRVVSVSEKTEEEHVHSYSNEVVEPTCTEQGYTTHTCACGDSFVDAYTPASGHIWDSGVITVEPTEESAGIRLFTCTVCSNTREEVVPTLDHVHDYIAADTEPTCTDQGFTTYTCRCGDSYKDNYVSAKGHNFGEWTVVKETCTENGSKTRSCSRCDKVETEVIPAPGHEYKIVKTEATCETDGYTTHTCAACGHSYVTDEVKALGHKYSYEVTTKPTLDAAGKVEGICERCGKKVELILPKLNEDDYKYEVVTAPTEDAEGLARYTFTDAEHGSYSFEIKLDKLITVLRGDVNDDGLINVLDLMYLANYFAKGEVINKKNADVNVDGSLNVIDLMYLANYFAGKETLD